MDLHRRRVMTRTARTKALKEVRRRRNDYWSVLSHDETIARWGSGRGGSTR